MNFNINDNIWTNCKHENIVNLLCQDCGTIVEDEKTRQEILKRIELNGTITLILGQGREMKKINSASIRYHKGLFTDPMGGVSGDELPTSGTAKIICENYNEWMSFKFGLDLEFEKLDKVSYQISW